jgi:hypothetical protein
MNDLKFTTAGDYIKDQETAHEPPEPCFMIEGEWAKDSQEEKDERTLGRKIQTENRQ